MTEVTTTLPLYVVSLLGRISVSEIDDAAELRPILLDHLDKVMEELEQLTADDPGIELDLGECKVTFEVMVAAKNPLLAAYQASGLLRTAIHAAGGATPDWPSPHSEAWEVELLEMTSKVLATNDEGNDDCDAEELVGA